MRTERYTWDDTWMSMAVVMAERSPDPNTQVGSVIISQENKLISGGYNGTPKGICPSSIPWDREGEPGKTKYDWIIHSEQNAIDNATASTKNGKCYVTLQCCNNCSMSLIQAGIKEIIYLDDKYKDMWFTKIGLDMLERVDIIVRKHEWSDSYIKIQGSK